MNVFFKWNKPNLSSKPCYRVSSHRPCIFCVDLWRFFNKETKLCNLKKYTKTRTRIWDVCTFFILVSIYCLLSNNVRVFKCLILLLLKKKSLQTYMEKLYRVFYLIYHTNMINKCINLTEFHPNIKIMYNKKMNKK